MLAEQVLQLIFWLGVIICIPATYRVAYAAFALLWRRLFPTRKIDITVIDEEAKFTRTVHLTLDRKSAKMTSTLLQEALDSVKAKS